MWGNYFSNWAKIKEMISRMININLKIFNKFYSYRNLFNKF